MSASIGVIGIGAIAPFYLRAINQSANAVLTGICDINLNRLLSASGNVKEVSTDYSHILHSPDIDSVIVNLPNNLHAEVCEAALKAGKHVCCEKPLTISSCDAYELMKLSQSTGKFLFTAFHRRYNQELLAKLSLLDPEDRIVSIDAEYLEDIREHTGTDSWYLDSNKCGGGCISDNGPNVFDTVRFIVGDILIEKAFALRNENRVDMESWIHGRSLNGVPIDIHLDWGYEFGERKTITLVLESGRKIEIDFLANVKEFKGSLWHEYRGIVEDFVYHIYHELPSPIDGLKSVQLVEQTYAILTEGETPLGAAA